MPMTERLTQPQVLSPAVLTLCLGLAACGGGGSAAGEAAPASAPAASAASANTASNLLPDTANNPAEQVVTFTFDARHGGNPIIGLYPGVQATEADKVPVPGAGYYDGDIVKADCETTGRTVHTHPERGEDPVATDKWVRLSARNGGNPVYATEAYGEVNGHGAAVPVCPDPVP